MTVQLEYINYLLQCFRTFPIMLVLFQNYAGIIGWALSVTISGCLPLYHSVTILSLCMSIFKWGI